MCDNHFCWMWNNNCVFDWQSFWAGLPSWLQAIGALVGIIITLTLYYHQILRSSEDKEIAAASRRASQLRVGQQFSFQTQFLIINCMDAFEEDETYQSVIAIEPRMTELIIWSRVFVLDTYTLEELDYFVRIKDVLQQIAVWIKRSQFSVRDKNLEYVAEQLKNISIPLRYFTELNVD